MEIKSCKCVLCFYYCFRLIYKHIHYLSLVSPTLINDNCFIATGEVSDSDPSVSSSSQEEFNDGYDDKLMGDADDQARLAQMTEKEREQEIFKRIEQREIMKTRFEIEKKLRMAKKQELKKQKESKKKEKGIDEKLKIDRAPDPKERSKDRKKTIEEKQDKKFHAMSLLKARREEKKERGKVSHMLTNIQFERWAGEKFKHMQMSVETLDAQKYFCNMFALICTIFSHPYNYTPIILYQSLKHSYE